MHALPAHPPGSTHVQRMQNALTLDLEKIVHSVDPPYVNALYYSRPCRGERTITIEKDSLPYNNRYNEILFCSSKGKMYEFNM